MIDEFVQALWTERATAILRTTSADAARAAMEAAVEGGFRILEFTLTTPNAFGLIEEFAKRPGLIVGAGTVLLPQEAQAAVAAGAQFLVSPIADDGMIRRARQLGVAAIPGTHTPTEMVQAHRAGAPLVKLFPAPAGGPAYLRAVLAPLPFLRVVPTNGVDEQNAADWLRAGAFAVGFVASLFDAQDIAERRYDRIRDRARRIKAAVAAVERVDSLPQSSSKIETSA
ncbi:MAG TPA: bifunctional 4-hydroxy-2-oxoglutarate aldolase/2-dehydro-3-deoxy-phosphogluconate aldolase [Polyangiaceae bacterium]|nr:bifunctional 4-hydroxy-2-oxoglutarate aldolase/2-dehydro-3-deoxy-phosphogluconate aldolase [Polyangiaceae bacterium]